MRRDAEDVDAPGGVFDHREDVGGRAIEQVDGEEVGSQDGFCLGAQELAPGRADPARRGVKPRLPQRFPHGRRRDANAQAGQLTVNPAVAPARILAGQWLAGRVLLKVACLLMRWSFGLVALMFRGDHARDAELLVLRHENGVLRRNAGCVRYEPGDRAWFAALTRFIPRQRWTGVFQ